MSRSRRRRWSSTSRPSTPTPTTLAPARGGQADPGRVEVGAGPGPARAGAARTTAFGGVLAFTLREALWLHEQGVSDDLVVAYPTVDRAGAGPARRVARRRGRDHADGRRRSPTSTSSTPCAARSRSRSGSRSTSTPDSGSAASTSGPSARRSTTRARWSRLARRVVERRGFRLVGVMTYEGQVAGLPDVVPTQRAGRSSSAASSRRRSPSSRYAASRLPTRWRDVVRAGVLERRGLRARSSRPPPTRSSPRWPPDQACWCRRCSTTTSPSIRGRRRSSPCPSYVAHGPGSRPSTAAGWSPPGRPVATGCRRRGLPEGLHLTALEGAGEVQTPLTGPARLGCGRRPGVVPSRQVGRALRAHRTTSACSRATAFVDRVQTYRGLGLAF